jgi:hypothetical protein
VSLFWFAITGLANRLPTVFLASGGWKVFEGLCHFPTNEGLGAVSEDWAEVSRYRQDVSQTSEGISEHTGTIA